MSCGSSTPASYGSSNHPLLRASPVFCKVAMRYEGYVREIWGERRAREKKGERERERERERVRAREKERKKEVMSDVRER